MYGSVRGAPGNRRSYRDLIYRNKYSFQNPLFQNYKHLKSVQHILGFVDPQQIHSIVVFSADSTFKTAKIDKVCGIEDLISTIEKYADDVLTLNQVQFCVGRLEFMRLEITKKTDVEHQTYLAQKFGE